MGGDEAAAAGRRDQRGSVTAVLPRRRPPAAGGAGHPRRPPPLGDTAPPRPAPRGAAGHRRQLSPSASRRQRRAGVCSCGRRGQGRCCGVAAGAGKVAPAPGGSPSRRELDPNAAVTSTLPGRGAACPRRGRQTEGRSFIRKGGRGHRAQPSPAGRRAAGPGHLLGVPGSPRRRWAAVPFPLSCRSQIPVPDPSRLSRVRGVRLRP